MRHDLLFLLSAQRSTRQPERTPHANANYAHNNALNII